MPDSRLVRLAEEAALEIALLAHTTVGITADRDGAPGAYTQYGAMVDLVGLRLGFATAVRLAPFPS